jgi:hypothetical protein
LKLTFWIHLKAGTFAGGQTNPKPVHRLVPSMIFYLVAVEVEILFLQILFHSENHHLTYCYDLASTSSTTHIKVEADLIALASYEGVMPESNHELQRH